VQPHDIAAERPPSERVSAADVDTTGYRGAVHSGFSDTGCLWANHLRRRPSTPDCAEVGTVSLRQTVSDAKGMARQPAIKPKLRPSSAAVAR